MKSKFRRFNRNMTFTTGRWAFNLPASVTLIKPPDLDDVTWQVISAANSGDAATMRRLLAEDPGRSRTGYFTPPIHFAVREGQTEIDADAARRHPMPSGTATTTVA